MWKFRRAHFVAKVRYVAPVCSHLQLSTRESAGDLRHFYSRTRPLKSVIRRFCHYREMSQIIEQNSENHAEEASAPSLKTALGCVVSALEVSGESPSPLSPARSRHQRISPALPIAPAAMSRPPAPPTRAKPMPRTGSILPLGAGGPIWLRSRHTHKQSDFTLPPALPAQLTGALRPTLFPQSSAAFPPYPEIIHSAGLPLIVGTGT